jgi:hypothetical protein
MNQKLKITLLLTALLSTYSYATCTKQEVMKLIDKGFSKTEINSICDIQAKSTTRAKPKNKWITPSNSTCRSKGGKLHKGVCEAKWQQAKNICRASGGRLPSKNELVQVIAECGGNTSNNNSAHTENKEDPNYQSCYKRKGFGTSNIYWSSTTFAGYSRHAWLINFNNGNQDNDNKSSSRYVRCVRAGQ